jgi:hypothetical protein
MSRLLALQAWPYGCLSEVMTSTVNVAGLPASSR